MGKLIRQIREPVQENLYSSCSMLLPHNVESGLIHAYALEGLNLCPLILITYEKCKQMSCMISHVSMAVFIQGGPPWFIIFPKSRNTFQYPLSKRIYANAFRNFFLELLRLSSNSIASTSREEGLVTAQLHCAVWPIEQRSIGHTPLRRSVGDIKAF